MLPLRDNVPTDRFPAVTVALLVANVLAFFLVQDASLSLSGAAVDAGATRDLGAVPSELTSDLGAGDPPAWVTAFTSMFLHGGLLHLGGNLLFLWIFAPNVEDALGRLRFFAFYLLGGLAALTLQVAVDPSSAVPTIGASGAIAGVLGAYAVLLPRARVLTLFLVVFFFTVVEVPALVVLGAWLALQVVLGLADLAATTDEAGGVAYFAHIGGFVFGLLAVRLVAQRHKEVPPRLARRAPWA